MQNIYIFLLTLKYFALAKDVAVIIGGENSQGNTYSDTAFFTENPSTCINTQEFLNIRDIFNYEGRRQN